MSDLKTKPSDDSVQAFLDRAAGAARMGDCHMLIAMMKEATGVDPVMWGSSIVGFGRYAYAYASGRTGEWPVVGFSPRKNDLTLYIMPGFERYGALMEQLGKHRTGKSCLYIKRLADVDVDILKTLIEESVAAMASRRVA